MLDVKHQKKIVFEKHAKYCGAQSLLMDFAQVSNAIVREVHHAPRIADSLNSFLGNI
ncbi:hypothetical protein FC1_03410 [Flavobacterium columnare NBRC 100251 = ATCC 23463]|nr:hypothetical protein FC1_03410 [Flavobacterium columnare NBRC 100251 = ATCC 23463]